MVLNLSYFTHNIIDTFSVQNYDIDETGIAWENDIGKKYKRADNYPDAYWIDVENGKHFYLAVSKN